MINSPKILLTVILLLIFLILSNQRSYSQYYLEEAFPNLSPFLTPTTVVHSKDSSNRLFAAQLKGVIYVFDNSSSVSTRKVFLNIDSKLQNTGPQEGLLGLTFHYDFPNNPYFFVHYVFDSVGSPVRKWIRVSRFSVSPSNPDSAIFSSEKTLIKVPLPDRNHNGGQLAFGPDNKLYIALGDGYAGGDVSQDRTQLLGKILRIDVDSNDTGLNYSIPADNPFYTNTSGWRKEIFAYGFRNPWKFSFDPPTGRMWLGDVGQYRYEELNIVESGKNYGWNKMEGFHCYPDTTICDTAGRNFTLPVHEYLHLDITQPYAVICGSVYRGSLLPALTGKLIFADFSQGNVQTLDYDGVNPPVNEVLLDTTINITSVDVDQYNEPLIVKYSGSDGRIYRLRYSGPLTIDMNVIIEGLYNENSNTMNLSDTVTVYLHNASTPYELIDSATSVIDSLNFKGNFSFYNSQTGLYYIRVKHKNTLETWSVEGGIQFTRGVLNTYDFTDDAIKTFGSRIKLIGNKYCLISGDINQDGVINAIDRAAVVTSLGMTGFSYNDLDGNGIVDTLDRRIVLENIGNTKSEP
ncbi:MAG: PQQ-dependent sugar dehydrogenase [Ignavibacteria bacterium]|nr:PQQ-dependent sugar dehydrogenase [Ignavibacteria bacterium]